MNADKNRKIELEKRYGKKQLTNMMNIMLDDEYMKANAKRCPKCQAPIQKSEGCNKMACTK